MHLKRQKVDACTVQSDNCFNKNRIEHTIRMALKYATDPDKKDRREQLKCLVCYYAESKIGGASCSRRQCAFCSEFMHSSNTCVDVLCAQCAKQAGLCVECGADIELKDRRKINFPPKLPEIGEREYYGK